MGGAGENCSLTADNDLLKLLHLILLVVVGQLVEDFVAGLGLEVTVVLESLSTDSAGKLQVLPRHGHSVGVNGAKVGILEEASEIALGSLLEGEKSL